MKLSLWLVFAVATMVNAERVPKTDLPARFPEQAAGVTADPVIESWWETLGDPELTALIARAAKSNLDLKMAQSRLLESRAERRITRAGLLPTVENSDSLQRVRGGLTQGIFHLNPNEKGQSSLLAPFETNIFQFGFDASWEIDFFGGRRHALQAATAEVSAQQESLRDTLVSLLAEVARNYAELRGVQERLDITRRNIRIEADSLDLTKTRAEAGLGTQLDVERELSLLASTEAQIPALDTLQGQSIRRLSVLMGTQPETLRDELLTARPLPTVPPAIPEGLPANLLKRRPDIRKAESEIAAAAAQVGVARADLFPKITLTGAAGRQGTNFSGLTLGAGNFFAIGPGIKLPIFTGGKIRANIEARKQQLDQSVLQYQSTVLRSLEETGNAIDAYGRERERFVKLAAAAEASKQAAGLADELYVHGLSDFLAVLDSQRQQLAAEDELARSGTAVVQDLVALYKALGGGWNAGL